MTITKGSASALTNNGTKVTKLALEVGWDATASGRKGLLGRAMKKKGVDLDALAVLLRADKNPQAACYYDNLTLFGGALQHSGDNTSGAGDGADETITIDLDRIPAVIEHIVLAIMAKDKDFSNAANAQCEIIDLTGGRESLGVVYMPILSDQNAFVSVKLSRVASGGWDIKQLDEFFKIGKGPTAWQELAKKAGALV
jgi:tellurium resistance protein TerZ